MTVPMMRRPHPKRQARPLAPHAHPLVRQFFTLMEGEGIALTDTAGRAGLGVATLVKWKYRHMPQLDTFMAALNVIGYELRIVRQRERIVP